MSDMSNLPTPNQSRTESYLGAIIGQPGAVKPVKPQDRVEEYLDYIAEHGGGGGGDAEPIPLDDIREICR